MVQDIGLLLTLGSAVGAWVDADVGSGDDCCLAAHEVCSCPFLRVNSRALCIRCIPEWLLCHKNTAQQENCKFSVTDSTTNTEDSCKSAWA